ncbi:MAG: tetratricopeptide repeat protein, partial [Tepidiformaceae bacterium]
VGALLIFYVSSRYRMPSAPSLILFAAAGTEWIWEGLTSIAAGRRTEARIYGIVALVCAGIFHVQVDESHKIQEANVHYNAGNQHYNRKQYERALAEYGRALAGDPTNWRASYNMGNTLDALGRKQEAIESFREVLKRNERMDGARRRIRKLGGTP